jgi:hypothetical protein
LPVIAHISQSDPETSDDFSGDSNYREISMCSQRLDGDLLEHLALSCRVESRPQETSDVDLQWEIDAEEPAGLAVVSVAPGGSANHVFRIAGAADWHRTPEELPDSPPLDAAYGIAGPR